MSVWGLRRTHAEHSWSASPPGADVQLRRRLRRSGPKDGIPVWARLCSLMPKDAEVRDLPVPADPVPNNAGFHSDTDC